MPCWRNPSICAPKEADNVRRLTYLVHLHCVTHEQSAWLPLAILLHCQVSKTHVDIENHVCKGIKVNQQISFNI